MVARSRGAGAAVGVAVAISLVAGCGAGGGATTTAPEPNRAGSISAADVGAIDCAPYDQYGDLSGATVTSYGGPLLPPMVQAYDEAWAAFERCTGVDVQAEWSGGFEYDLVVRVEAGDAPDVAMLTQPAYLASIVNDTGAVVPLGDQAETVAREGFGEDWLRYGRVNGEQYAFPFAGASSKSLVWYSPRAFAQAGYEVPARWDELLALSDRIVGDHPDGSVKPWCAGIEEGSATGWPLTDWVEDVMLRQQGPDYYDDWVSHAVPFNAAESVEVWEAVGSVLRNPAYVNGGIGDVASIAEVSFTQAGLPILDGDCMMTKSASFLAPFWPQGTTIAEDGDVFAFPFPSPTEAEPGFVLAAGNYVAAFDDRPEVQAFMLYLASEDFHATTDTEAFGFVSPHNAVTAGLMTSSLGRLVAQQFQQPDVIVRFDGSDLMPGAVGAGAFWSEGTAWVADGTETQATLDAIEASWPS